VKLAFTGTRHGMTLFQKDQLRARLEEGDVDVLIHGDCIGADADADQIAAELGIPREAHPSDISNTRAWCGDRGATNMGPPRHPLDRNVTIAHRGDELFAAPRGMVEEVRSRPWHCVRVARRLDRKVAVAWPQRTDHD
jgi:hypothetical protein